MNVIFLIIGVLIGFAASYFIFKYKSESKSSKFEERISYLSTELEKKESELNLEREEFLKISNELSSLKADFKNLKNKLSDQGTEFKNIVNQILKEKSKEFTELNKTNLNEILNPLKEKIKDFEQRITQTHIDEVKQRASLIEQIKFLTVQNQQISKDAKDLTNALKGEIKTQGNWGEFILESILEKSGLVKDREYTVQESFTTENGNRLQPDVLINLPDKKTIIIDSKVSLNAYEKYSSSDDEVEKQKAIKDHLISITKHIKELSEKNYQNLYQLNSLDFVLMFLPIEPAFGLAIQAEQNLFITAYEKNIILVSPTTLLATLRTIANIWKQAYQNKNALEIARQSGALYDKFQGLLKDLQNVGDKLLATQTSYDSAIKKLHTGKGNLISSVEKIKKLGAKTTKSLPSSFNNLVDEDNTDE
ncbi:MAG: DNA recombination protein RmuC [Bacteroidetes bacterium]|nr:DNA recombination protein RmuC [Bacteroidota bacterium]